MPTTGIRFSTFPRTEPPPAFVNELVAVFRQHESRVATRPKAKGLKSDEVLSIVRPELEQLGFEVESGKSKASKIERPVFFGENGVPTVRYEIDAYHPGWRCGLEVEAGRGWMGNAVYRDLVQAAVMVGIDFLCIAVANNYCFKTGGRDSVSKDYDNARQLADAIYGHSRLKLPYGLVLLGS